MLKLRLLTGPRAGRQLRVSDTKPVSIGRRKGRLRLHDSRVSKNHAEIFFDNDVWVLRDLGSANGTYVNRNKVQGLAELEPGDLVQMGRVLMKIVRCDMIGMDTQAFDPDDSFSDAADGVGLAEPAASGDDLDLDALFGEPDNSDAKDDSFAGKSVEAPPAPDKDEPAAESSTESSGSAELDEIELEPMSVAFDEEVDDDDSFFADLGELTDTSDGKDVSVEDAPGVTDEPPADDQIDLEEPIKLKATDSTAAEIELPVSPEAEEQDPFLPDGPAEEETDGDLISLDDESHMGPRSHGTTLLTAAHDDGTPVDEAEQSDAVDVNEEDEDDDEPPALVGLALDHAPPQQPTIAEEVDDPADDELEDHEAEALSESDAPVLEQSTAEEEPVGEHDSVVAEAPEIESETIALDEEPEAISVADEAELEAEEAVALGGVDESEAEEAPIAAADPEPEVVHDDEAGAIDAEPAVAETPAVDDEPVAVEEDVQDEAEASAFDFNVLEEDEDLAAAAAAVDEELGPEDDGPEDTEAENEFDIDAAFDELSVGLDDSLSGAPTVDENSDEDALSAQEATEPAADLEPEQSEPDTDSLMGSQLDVGFIKEALSRLEDGPEQGEPAEDEADGPKAAAAVTEPVAVEPEGAVIDEPQSLDSAPDPVIQSPPPGLSAAGMNPTTYIDPEEPRRSYGSRRKGGGKWFFMLLALAILGGGGFLVGQNYDALIGKRTDPDANGSSNTDVAQTPTTQSEPVAGVDDQDPVDDDTDAGVPGWNDPGAEGPAEDGSGPNPFSDGPSVIGSAALDGLLRGSGDTRPLDPPREGSSSPITGSDPIRNPGLPGIGENVPDPGVQNPTEKPDPVDDVPTVPDLAEQKPARIVFLVDASGSLVDSLPQMLVWLNQALRTVEENEQFAILFFKSGKPIAIKPEGMLKPSRNLLNTIAEEYLNANRMPVFPSGRSDPSQAIAEALSLEPTDIYLLSDDSFAFHQGDTTSQQAIGLVKQAIGEAEVRVHGVQFFYKSEQSILESLANQYKGTFEFVRESVVPDEDPIDLLEELEGE